MHLRISFFDERGATTQLKNLTEALLPLAKIVPLKRTAQQFLRMNQDAMLTSLVGAVAREQNRRVTAAKPPQFYGVAAVACPPRGQEDSYVVTMVLTGPAGEIQYGRHRATTLCDARRYIRHMLARVYPARREASG